MWVLLISLYVHEPLGHVQSKGVIQAPFAQYESCTRERDRVKSTWRIEGFNISARCIYVPHYNSFHQGVN